MIRRLSNRMWPKWRYMVPIIGMSNPILPWETSTRGSSTTRAHTKRSTLIETSKCGFVTVELYLYYLSCFDLGTAKGFFWSSIKLAPAHLSTTHGGCVTLSLLNAERQAGKLWISICIVFGLTRLGIRPGLIFSVADASIIRSPIGILWGHANQKVI